jgi:hypothetical protein
MDINQRDKCEHCGCTMRWHTLEGDCSLCKTKHPEIPVETDIQQLPEPIKSSLDRRNSLAAPAVSSLTRRKTD